MDCGGQFQLCPKNYFEYRGDNIVSNNMVQRRLYYIVIKKGGRHNIEILNIKK